MAEITTTMARLKVEAEEGDHKVVARTLGRRDLFPHIVSGLRPWDVVAYMCACKRLNELGLEWLKRHGRAWVPRVDSTWKYSQLRMAALWAFGRPKQVLMEEVEWGIYVDVSRQAIWKASCRAVTIRRREGQRTVLVPDHHRPHRRPWIRTFESENQTIGLVGVHGRLGLIPENHPEWIPLCDDYFLRVIIDLKREAQWVAYTVRIQDGFAIRWASIPAILRERRADRTTVNVTSNQAPVIKFVGSDLLSVTCRVDGNSTTRVLNLLDGTWSVEPPRYVPPSRLYTERGVLIGQDELYTLNPRASALELKLKKEGLCPTIRSFSISNLRRGLKTVKEVPGDEPRIFLHHERDGLSTVQVFQLEAKCDVWSLEDAVRINGSSPLVNELMPGAITRYRSELADHKKLEHHLMVAAGIFQEHGFVVPPFSVDNPVANQLQVLLTAAIYNDRPDLITQMVQKFIRDPDALLPDFSLGHSFHIACDLGAIRCARALMNSGALRLAINPEWAQSPAKQLEEWPLTSGLYAAIQNGRYQVATDVVRALRDSTPPNSLARRAIFRWLVNALKGGGRGNLRDARELLFELIMREPSVLQSNAVNTLIDKLSLWTGEWGSSHSIDLATSWHEDQLQWEKTCKNKKSICWELIVELRAGRHYPTLGRLIRCWLRSPLFPGTEAALKSYLRLNPASRKRRKTHDPNENAPLG